MDEFQHYSIRRLSPFRGTLHILETQDAQAYTKDGLLWRIQIRTVLPRQSWGALDQPLSMRVVIVGEWTAKSGLLRIPLNPLLNHHEVDNTVSQILSGLEKYHEQLPFPAEDIYELWLLDSKQQLPLALLASSRDEDHLTNPPTMRWKAAEISDHSFTSKALLESSRPEQEKLQYHYEVINSQVRKLAGTTGCAQWFRRTPDGGGIGLHGEHLQSSLQGRSLSADVFPELLIREAGGDQLGTAMMMEYIDWLAPRLLTLLGLQTATRKYLEDLAFKRALEVNKYYRLYPEVFDETGLNAALVEAQLRYSSGEQGRD
ncbi:MAG: hypothetical protein HKM94_02310 [Halobacteria archaeon]|nr:hypothetical protein [Halobacteria archaeon]